jgi:hypothetical protein
MIAALSLLACTCNEPASTASPTPQDAVVPEPDPPATPAATTLPAPGMALDGSPKLAMPSCTATTSTVTVQLGLSASDLAPLYPTSTTVPPPYDKPTQPDDKTYLPSTLDGSIELFTRNSLALDGFTGIDVTADSVAGTVVITATGCNLADYTTQLPAFLAAGRTGYAAWTTCLQEGNACHGMDQVHTCTNDVGDPDPKPCPPWVFYLPLGQPLVNHQGVMLLNYPPDDALCAADYQNNFTMTRWRQVLSWAVEDPYLWADIVDVHPIAAAGSGESQGIAATTSFFAAYWQQMLAVVTNPPNLASRPDYTTATLPVMVSGSPSHDVWQAFIGSSSPVEPVPADNSLGTTSNLVAGRTTRWVATNHPDVASYNCCTGDHSATCCDGTYDPTTKTCTGGYGWSWDLYDDEVSDFTGSCYFLNTSAAPEKPFGDFALTCARGIEYGQFALCVQGRMDYTFTESTAHCNCREAAEAFCLASEGAMCPDPTALTACTTENTRYCPDPTTTYVTCATL